MGERKLVSPPTSNANHQHHQHHHHHHQQHQSSPSHQPLQEPTKTNKSKESNSPRINRWKLLDQPKRDLTQEYFQRSLESVSGSLSRNRRFSIAGDRSTLPSLSTDAELAPNSSVVEPDQSIRSSDPHNSNHENKETVEAANVLLGLGSSKSTVSFNALNTTTAATATATTTTTTTTVTNNDSNHDKTDSYSDSRIIPLSSSLNNDRRPNKPSMMRSKDPGMVIEDMLNASIQLSSEKFVEEDLRRLGNTSTRLSIDQPPQINDQKFRSNKKVKLLVDHDDSRESAIKSKEDQRFIKTLDDEPQQPIDHHQKSLHNPVDDQQHRVGLIDHLSIQQHLPSHHPHHYPHHHLHHLHHHHPHPHSHSHHIHHHHPHPHPHCPHSRLGYYYHGLPPESQNQKDARIVKVIEKEN